MEWTDIRLTVAKADAENAEAVATLIAEGGIYIEDYSDIEQQVAEIAHVDLIEQELLDKPRDTVIIHLYLEPGASQVETLALIAARMEAAGIPYTVETEGVEQEDWQNGWRKYYHPMEIGSRLAVVPSWQQYDTDRVKLILDPGLAFGTGGHETTSLCLEALDEQVRGGERVLDIGTGSGILAIAALKLGAASAEGVDIDPVAVRTAGENAALNGVQDKLTVLVGDLSDKASGTYDIITANIVANAILSLAPAVPGLMAEGATFIASGIIDSRKDEVIAGLEKAGLSVVEVKEKRGWECIVCKKGLRFKYCKKERTVCRQPLLYHRDLQRHRHPAGCGRPSPCPGDAGKAGGYRHPLRRQRRRVHRHHHRLWGGQGGFCRRAGLSQRRRAHRGGDVAGGLSQAGQAGTDHQARGGAGRCPHRTLLQPLLRGCTQKGGAEERALQPHCAGSRQAVRPGRSAGRSLAAAELRGGVPQL